MFRKNSANERCLVIYDISDDRKRRRFCKIMEAYGKRVQKSAFEMNVSETSFREIREKIYIFTQENPRENVRIYRMHEDYEVITFRDLSAFELEKVIVV